MAQSWYSLGVVGDYAWSIEAHEWNVFCSVSYILLCYLNCAPNQFYYDPYCIQISSDSATGFHFALQTGRVSFSLITHRRLTPWRLLTASTTMIYLICISTKNDMSLTRVVQFWSSCSEMSGHWIPLSIKVTY